MNYNRVMLMGNLTRDVDIRHTQSNQAVGNFGLAVNRKYKTASGETREDVLFIDCAAWGRTAEVMAQYLGKGKPVFIEGRLQMEQWETDGGEKRSKVKVVVESFQFVGGGGAEKSDKPASNRPASKQPASKLPHAVADDDIPF